MFFDASEDTMCIVAYLRSHPKEKAADLAFLIARCGVTPENSIPRQGKFNTATGIASSTQGSEAEITDNQETQNEHTYM